MELQTYVFIDFIFEIVLAHQALVTGRVTVNKNNMLNNQT